MDSWSSAPRIRGRPTYRYIIAAAPISSADVKWQVLREKRLSHKSLESVESPENGSFWTHLLKTNWE